MKCLLVVLMATAFLSVARADYVELKDGRRVQGVILRETNSHIEIRISQNEAGTIRQILSIDLSEIKSWAADEGKRVASGALDEKELNRLQGEEYLNALIRSAETAVSERDFDTARKRLHEVVELTVTDIESVKSDEDLRAFDTRAHAYKLLVATLEGKENLLEVYIKEGEERIKSEEDMVDERIKAFRDKKAEIEKARKGSGNVKSTLGRSEMRALQKEEEILLERVELVRNQHLRMKEQMKLWKEEIIALQAEATLMDERADKAKDDAKSAARILKNRSRSSR